MLIPLINGILVKSIKKILGQIKKESKLATNKTQVLDTNGSYDGNRDAIIVLIAYAQAAPRTNKIPKRVLLPLLIEGPRIKRTPDIPIIKPKILKRFSLSFGKKI